MSPVAMEMLLRLGSTPEGRREIIDLFNRACSRHRLTPGAYWRPPPACCGGRHVTCARRIQTAQSMRQDLARRILAHRPHAA
jgi:hypothetical protein